MKFVVLIIALFALSASARIDPREAYIGFATQLGLTEEQMSQISKCGQSVGKLFAPFAPTFDEKTMRVINPAQRFAQFVMDTDLVHTKVVNELYTILTTETQPICSAYFMTLYQSIFKNAQYPAYTARSNIKIHASVLISKVTLLFDQIHEQKSKEAGSTFAYILQVIYGAVEPTTPKVALRHGDEKAVEAASPELLYTKFINAAAKALGATEEVTQKDVEALLKSVTKVFEQYVMGKIKVRSTSTPVERLIVEFNVARDIILAVRDATEAAGTAFKPYLNKVHISSKYEFRQLVLRSIHNFLLNLPTIEAETKNMGTEMREFHPVAAGKNLAEILKLVF